MKNRRPKIQPTVTPIDIIKVTKELKTCPKIVRDYVKSLEFLVTRLEDTRGKAVGKILVMAKEIKELKNK